MKLEKAQKIAEEFLAAIAPYCEQGRCFIAGSIRRECDEVGDIEIVCQPKKVHVGNETLFSDTKTGEGATNIGFMKVVNAFPFIAGKATGRQAKRMHPDGIQLDIYMPQPHDFFRIFAIRTGNSDFSRIALATSWRKIGWVGTEDGLRRETECKKQGTKWICIADNPTLPPVWRNETEFFIWLGMEYVAPKNRSI